MVFRMVAGAAVLIAATVASADVAAYEQAFEKTAVGEVEVRTLPPARLLTTERSGSYFDESSRLFRRLFDYIRVNDVAMTIPVESGLDHAAMRFYVGGDAPQSLQETDEVSLVVLPARRVASFGGRGMYSESNLTEARDRLRSWLDAQSQWTADGEPYAVYWNGPFTPWFMKRFEVHVPIKPADNI